MKHDEYPFTPEDVRFMEMAARLAEENVDRGGGPLRR